MARDKCGGLQPRNCNVGGDGKRGGKRCPGCGEGCGREAAGTVCWQAGAGELDGAVEAILWGEGEGGRAGLAYGNGKVEGLAVKMKVGSGRRPLWRMLIW